ncbi:chemotaxis protein CheW [Candidatus Enterococcus willemsii]|uniref:Chemotaxis protein CheW n=1 Tax=Candidatus Enterococcus willemsii TaxID=1857215 RepID=A0ABQ6YWE7_9ENTE|nr:chemotaxis protein CheW [Enterococcus sp. CU12B]KAF1302027.1 chemotaxis protein CheW [Enterococcus sp. CU12B]
MEQYVVFKSHNQLFAIRVKNVDRVIEANRFIALPEVAEFILGVYEYHDNMIPIVDVRKKLFGKFSEQSEESKVILCRWQNHSQGLYVEDIIGISYMEETNYEQDFVQALLKKGYIEKFLKLEDEVVMLIELDYLFNNEQTKQAFLELEQLANAEENGDGSN